MKSSRHSHAQSYIFRQRDAAGAPTDDVTEGTVQDVRPRPSGDEVRQVRRDHEKFSVIIPLYNKEAEIERTLRSVLAQTVVPLEIIVVDDGSTDGSAAVVERVIAELSDVGNHLSSEQQSGNRRELSQVYEVSPQPEAAPSGGLKETSPPPTSGCVRIQHPEIKLIRQANAGETAARNHAMSLASGDYLALIDADDEWKPGFLAEIARLTNEFPHCGLYSTGFDIVNTSLGGSFGSRSRRQQGSISTGKSGGNRDDNSGAELGANANTNLGVKTDANLGANTDANLVVHPAHTIATRGPVDDFFHASMTAYVSIPSASVIPRRVFELVGGFPEGMRMGGDQYMWIKIARRFPVCFSPERLVRYYMAASNRSAAIYKPENTAFSFEDFLDDPAAMASPNDSAVTPLGDKSPSGNTADNNWMREFVARVALGKALTVSAKGGTEEGLRAERVFAFNRHSRRLWWRLWVLNRLPASWRGRAHALYTDLAWHLARKGL